MTDLQAQAKDYAKDVILRLRGYIIFSEDVIFDALAEAYEQGYIDCDTKGEQSETQDEYFDDAPDCRYFSDGNCTKGLPGTPCERKGCMAYYPKESERR